MAEVYQVTLDYEWHKQGWTETFYYEGTLGQAKVDAEVYNAHRLAFMSVDIKAVAARISNVNIRGDGEFIPQIDLANKVGDIGEPIKYIDTGYMFRFQTATQRRRMFIARGIYASAFGFGVTGLLQVGNVQKDRFAQWLVFMAEPGTPWRMRTRPTWTPALGEQITAVLVEGTQGRRVAITTTAPHNLAARDLVQINGFEGAGLVPLNGINKVLFAPTATQFVIQLRTSLNPIPLGEEVAFARKFTYVYEAFNKATLVGVSDHDTGRAFFVPAGRSSGRKQ